MGVGLAERVCSNFVGGVGKIWQEVSDEPIR